MILPLAVFIFMAVLETPRLSAIPGFTAKSRLPNFGRRLAVLKGPEIAKTRPPSPIQFLAVFVSFGSLHLLENPRLSAIYRQGRHQLRQLLLAHLFLAEMTVWLVGIGGKTAKNRRVHARASPATIREFRLLRTNFLESTARLKFFREVIEEVIERRAGVADAVIGHVGEIGQPSRPGGCFCRKMTSY